MHERRQPVVQRVVASVVVEQPGALVNQIAQQRQTRRRQAEALGFECHSFAPLAASAPAMQRGGRGLPHGRRGIGLRERGEPRAETAGADARQRA